MKYSKQRDALLTILKNTTSHPTADTLYTELREEIPNISLGTVYRNLAQLSRNNEILAIETRAGKIHFDGNPEMHYHFVCDKCGRMYDVDIPYHKEIDNEASEKTGGDIESHDLIFYGICADCKSASLN